MLCVSSAHSEGISSLAEWENSFESTQSSADVEKKSKLSICGYSEVLLSRNFYSDIPARNSLPEDYRNASGHGRFDIPHAVIFLGYDFYRGWTFYAEIEFDYGGNPAYEKEAEDGGEWKSETEAGGEVEFNSFICRTRFLVGMHSYA